jgi:hypothetical protein
VAAGARAFPIARALMIAFFAATTVVAALASFTLLITGTAIDDIWSGKEHGYHQMLQHRIPIGLGFALLAVLLALAAIGWARRRRWGWLLGAVIFGIDFVSNLAALITSASWINALPVVVEGLILMWMLLPRTRAQF